MADISTNIELSAVGADAAASEIQKVSTSLNQITTSSSQMQNQFQHRFQHIGLMLFAGDAMRASGLGAETRMVVGALNTALIGAESSFGAAAGPAFLFIAALTALVGITIKVTQHHKDEIDALQKVTDTRQKELTAVETTISALDKYAAAGGKLTIAQKQLLTASQTVEQHLRTEQIVTLQKSIAAIEANRQSIILHANALSVWHTFLADAKAVFAELLHVAELFSPVLSGIEALYTKLSSSMSGFSVNIKKNKADTDTMNAALDKNAQLLAQKKVDLEALKHGFDVMGDAAVAAEQKELEGRRKVEAAMKADIDAEHAHERASMDSLIAANIKAHQEEAKQEIEITKQVAQQMGTDIGNAFAKMIVEGADFATQMQAAFKQMAEQIISDIIRVEVEWMILQSMGFPVGAGGGFSSGLFGGAFASGGSVVVDKPTMFLAGEAGPERATFTPIGQSSGDGGSGSSVGTVNIVLNVGSLQGNDPAGTLDMLSQEIRRETTSARQFAVTVAGVAGRYPKQAY